MKVRQVTKTGFTTADGRYFPHPIPLDEVPPVEVFRRVMDHWEAILKRELSRSFDDFDDTPHAPYLKAGE